MSRRGGQPRKRTMDLAIAATANVHSVPLLSDSIGDFRIISDVVDAREPVRADAAPAETSPPSHAR